MGGALCMFLFGAALIATGLFGLIFMSWTLLALYMVVAAAAVLAAIATA